MKKIIGKKRILYTAIIGFLVLFNFSNYLLAVAPPNPKDCVTDKNSKVTEYCLLAPIPLNGSGNGVTEKIDISNYLKGMFNLIIGIAGLLAVVMIIYSGLEYITTDAFGKKSAARQRIGNDITGLILAICSWVILYTINPKLVEINFNIAPQEIDKNAQIVAPGNPSGSTTCSNCSVVGVPHKPASAVPPGCLPPGPCMIDSTLNTKLISLNSALSNQPPPRRSLALEVTESYPPTRAHADSCHINATCVDANFKDRSLAQTSANIKTFIETASASGLRAVYEVQTQTRANTIVNQTGLSPTQVIVVSGINAEHFSIYSN